MSLPPWLSVVIPTYQGSRFLGEALESIAIQWDNSIEVIAIDDGSTDDTPAILLEYEHRIGLRIIACGRTGDWVCNTVKALNEARGTYLCMLHQDDLWLPSRIATLRRAIQQHPAAGIYLNPSRFVDETGRNVGSWSIPLPTHRLLPPDEVLPHLIVQNFIALPAPVFRRDIWEPVGDMDASLWFLADWKLWGTLIAGTLTVVLPETLTSFRLHLDSQTSGRTHNADDLRLQYVTVISEIARSLDAGPTRRKSIQAAELNADICIAMAQWSHGSRGSALSMLAKVRQWRLGVWLQFFRDSRIQERTLARLRAGVHHRKHRTVSNRHEH